MLEIIQDVLAAEERAAQLLDQAKKDASDTRTSYAEEEARQLRETETTADQLVREKLARERKKHEERIARAEEESRRLEMSFESREQPGLGETVARVVQLVIHGPGDTPEQTERRTRPPAPEDG